MWDLKAASRSATPSATAALHADRRKCEPGRQKHHPTGNSSYATPFTTSSTLQGRARWLRSRSILSTFARGLEHSVRAGMGRHSAATIRSRFGHSANRGLLLTSPLEASQHQSTSTSCFRRRCRANTALAGRWTLSQPTARLPMSHRYSCRVCMTRKAPARLTTTPIQDCSRRPELLTTDPWLEFRIPVSLMVAGSSAEAQSFFRWRLIPTSSTCQMAPLHRPNPT